MTQPAYELVFIVDRSGSMAGVAGDMQKALNDLIAKQREVPGECCVTLAQFDNEYDLVCDATPLADVQPYVLRPRGATALLDAIGRTLVAVGERVDNLAVKPNVIVTIITDGYENASMEWDRPRVFDAISARRGVSGWEFVFLGADQDAIAEATKLGISGSNAVSYQNSAKGNAAVGQVLSCALFETRTSGGAVLRGAGGQSIQAAYNAQMDATVPPPVLKAQETTTASGIVVLDSGTADADSQ